MLQPVPVQCQSSYGMPPYPSASLLQGDMLQRETVELLACKCMTCHLLVLL